MRDHATKLPPLNGLRVFEAAARHGSFTRAAAELHVTQGAVSQAIRTLEEHLGNKLFDRTAGGLQLTPGGALYARAIGLSFQSIVDATAAFRSARRVSVVTIRAYTSFLTYWLIPKVPDFQAKHPEVELRFIAANDRVRVDREHVDLRVRYGNGRWRGLEAMLLLRDEQTPVISPALLPVAGAPYDPEALCAFTWLHSSQRRADWQDWKNAAGKPELVPVSNTVVEELSVVYRLSIAGVGVALGNGEYLAEELVSGRLFRPVTSVLRRDAGYYLTWPDREPLSAASASLRVWLDGLRRC